MPTNFASFRFKALCVITILARFCCVRRHVFAAALSAAPDVSKRQSRQCSSAMTLQHFLGSVKDVPIRHAVIGNEAGDADSIVSAIGWAYVDSLRRRQSTKESSDKTKHLTPVISIPKIDLETQRPETLMLMKLAGVQPNDLVFLDNPLWNEASGLDTTLVDHNRLTAKFNERNHRVVEIIDHHLDEGHHQESCLNRIVAFEDERATVASTCTLIVEQLKQVSEPPYSAALSIMLLGVILLDSVNMSASAGKATPRDEVAINSLLAETEWSTWEASNERKEILASDKGVPDATALFHALQQAKFSSDFWNSLTINDSLRLDYKQFSCGARSFGLSTVLLSMADFRKKDNMVKSFDTYMRKVEVNLFGVMLTHSLDSGKFQRELILCGRHTASIDALVHFLRQEQFSLELTETIDTVQSKNDDFTVRFFSQGNAKASRKRVAPLILEFVQNSKPEI